MVGINVKRVLTETYVAGEDLSDYQYYGVTMSDDRECDLHDAATDIPAGILLNTPESGQESEVLVIGRCPIVAAETITAGQQIRIGANGKAYAFEVDTDVTTYCCGYCVIGAGDGEKIEAVINCATCYRGEE